ncbi:MAG: DUF4271 domain-containing protein [Sphingomonadales bacterium]|nr:DUF4271 domain-containing protein [Sphingomonadales bacterium]
MLFKLKNLAFMFLGLSVLAADVTASTTKKRTRRERIENTEREARSNIDTQKISRSKFIDSLRKDSLCAVLKSRFTIKYKDTIIPRIRDPFDPFVHQAFYRVGQAKFWFFIISLVVLGLFIYYRAAFPKQFYQRYRGVFNNYYFNELIMDRSLSFTSGSLVCVLLSTFVMAQTVILIAVYSQFLQLNSVVFFIFMLIGVLAWKVMLYFSQRLQSLVFSAGEVSRSLLQKQVTVDFWASIIAFPLINIVYYNPNRLRDIPVSQCLLIMVVVWFLLKMLVQLVYLFREKNYSFTNILYFCALEVLPHAILTKTLFSISQTP